jgi:hypothetical protein
MGSAPVCSAIAIDGQMPLPCVEDAGARPCVGTGPLLYLQDLRFLAFSKLCHIFDKLVREFLQAFLATL